MKSELLTVYDLSREQLEELKAAYFWDDDTQDILPDDIIYPEQIPDGIIFDHYAEICFSPDDFSCSCAF